MKCIAFFQLFDCDLDKVLQTQGHHNNNFLSSVTTESQKNEIYEMTHHFHSSYFFEQVLIISHIWIEIICFSMYSLVWIHLDQRKQLQIKKAGIADSPFKNICSTFTEWSYLCSSDLKHPTRHTTNQAPYWNLFKVKIIIMQTILCIIVLLWICYEDMIKGSIWRKKNFLQQVIMNFSSNQMHGGTIFSYVWFNCIECW